MKTYLTFGSRWISRLLTPVLLSPFLLPKAVHATGIESPLRWIDQPYQGDKPKVLETPEFYFELEVRRIAAELKDGRPVTAPASPLLGTAKADLADFQDALAKKRIAPPDPAKAEKAHAQMRDIINGPGETADPAAQKDVTPIDEFASEFADYHRGAMAFGEGSAEDAKAAWNALLARPEAERHYRTTWALYMLGKAAIDDKDWAAAKTWFQKTRDAAKAGFADSLNLVGESFGWEAYANLQEEHFSEATRLYFEQLNCGDVSAVGSLKVVMGELFKEGADLEELVGDPLIQRLGTAGAVADMAPFPYALNSTDEDNLTAKWLKALESIDARNVRDADRVAWIAYGRGDYKAAQRWLARATANGPYVLWLRAKFALRDGKTDVATKLLAKAIDQIPQVARPTSRNMESSEISPYDAARGDLALLKMSSSDFLTAMKLFLQGGLYSDAFYVADGLLSTDELAKYLRDEGPKLAASIKPPEQAKKPEPAADSSSDASDAEPVEGEDLRPWHFYYYEDPVGELRSILARRLFRAKRYADARKYLTEEAQGWLDEYVALLAKATNAKLKKDERSEAYWAAAQIVIEHGEALADYFDPVTMARRMTGRTVDTGSYPEFFIKYGEPAKFFPPLSGSEKTKLKKNAAPELRRHYSSYLAADLGYRSAELMPDNDERTAERLNSAGTWIMEGDDKAADRIYQAIERRCAKTQLGREAIKRHWFVPGGVTPEQ